MIETRLETLCFDADGVPLHAVAAGPADGPVVVLLHGFPEHWISWRRQIAPLATAGYRVIVPDQRGYNLSGKPTRVADYRLARLGGDILAILDQLGVRRAFIAGHDFGATVTWWLLAMHPERFLAGATLNVPHPRVMQRWLQRSLRQIRRSWYMFFFQLPGLPERWFAANDHRAGLRLLRESSRPGTFSAEDLEDYRRAWSQPGALRAMIHWYRAAFRFPPPARTADDWKIRVPVLILWGEADRFLERAMAQQSLAFCDDGRCITLPGISHWVQHEAPQQVTEALLAHFAAPRG